MPETPGMADRRKYKNSSSIGLFHSRKTDDLRRLAVPKKGPRLDAKRFRYAEDIVDRNIALRPLDRTEIRAVDATLVGERFLTEPAFGAESAHILRQNVAQGSFVRPLHRRASCPLTFLGDRF
jgi:hypothetical protein